MIVFIVIAVEALIGVIFLALFSVASDADKQQEMEDEGKKYSGLLEED